MLIGMPAPDHGHLHEITDRTRFRRVMESRPGQRVQVIVQVAPALAPGRTEPAWWDWEVFAEGLWDSVKDSIPTPAYLQAVLAVSGAQYARPAMRAVI